ncbi:hypothetical protein CE91St36_19380 [Christensenellaceae bacterium]|nr:hypothetical protein CE91St36_19380 [Christensenellaceae bacterium]
MTAVGSNVYRSQELPKGTYYIVAINGVGLRSEARVTLDRIDTEPPTVTGTATITPTDWTNGKHTITVTGISDTGGSGVAAVFYATSATATSGTNLTYNEATGTATLTADLLDGSHTYYLRVKDGAGNFAAKTLSVVGKRDTTDPTVTPAVSPAGWAAAKTVSATVRDTQSGIKSVFLATAPNAESGTAMSRSGNTYTAPAVSKTGTYYVVAIDQAGNRKEASIAVDQIDVNKPTVTGATISPTGWTNGNHTVTVSGIADTGGSGIAQVFLATSATATSGTNMEYNAANGTATVTTALAEGTTTYYIRVKDGAGNFSDAVPSVVAKRDSAPPVISGARPSGGILTATVTDAASGVNRVFYSTTSGATSGTAMTKSGDVYTSAKISGAGIYYIVAYDNAGARSEARVDASDLVAPTFTGASINPSAWSNGASFTITASGISDTGGSGVASAFYSTSSSAVSGTAMTLNAAKTQATVTLTPPANAQTTYYLYIVDGSGNISSPRSVVAKRDTAAPTMSGATISPDTWTTQTTFTIRVTGIADTGGSGVSQVFYSTTENATSGTAMSRSGSTASATITAPKSQETKYYIRVKDAAGNLSTQQVVSAKNVQPGVDGPEVVAVTSHINTSTTTGGHSIQARIKAGFVATKGPEVTGAFMTFDPNATSGTNMSWSDGTGYGYWNGYLTNSENRPVYYIRLVDSAGLVGPAFEVSALEASLVFRTNHGNLTATISPSRGYVTTKKVVNVVATNVASYVTNVRFNFVRGTNDSSATTTIPMTKSGTTWTGSADITDNMQIYFDAYFDGASSSEGKGKTSIAPEPLWRSISNIDPAAPTITNVEQSTTGWVNSTTISAVVQDPDTHTDQYSRSNSSGIREVFWSKTSGATSGTAMSGSTYDSSSSPYKYKYTSKALTSPGTYYIVAYDNAGNRTQTSITLKNLDATAPTMTAASIDPSAWTDTSSFTITATGVADTGGSGVEGVYYSTTSNFTSGGTKMTLSGSTATATLTPPDNASTTYYVRVKDNAGNWSTQKSVAAKRDSSSPSITNAKQSSDTWGESKTISATVTDTGSGLKSVFWSKTSGATSGTAMTASGSTYTSGAINEEGTYYIVAYDNAGHRSQQSVTITKIDLAAPSMTGASISPDSWSNADSFTITATGVADTGSAGVEGVYYSTTSNFTSGGSGLADVFWTTTSGATEGNLMMDNGDVYTSGDLSEAGTYYIVAYDVAGNRTQTQVVVSNIDMEAPTVSGASILPAEWSNAESFTLTATGIADTGGSNVEGVYYSTTKNFTSGGTKMALTGNTATASITPPVNASTTYYVRVKDNAGNWSTQVSAVAKRDTAAPAITNVQNNAGQILATITDSGGSGLKSVFWSATDGATSGTALTPTEGDGYMTEPGALADNGAYYIVAYDNAGNRSQYAINVSNIDKEAPTFTGLAIDPASWSNAESFTLTATGLADTGGSGVAEVFCSTSSGAESGTRMTISGTTATLTLTPPANAQTTYYVRVKDGAGNLSAEKSIVAKRDTTIPSLTGASINPADWSNGSNYTITVEGVSDMGGSDVEGVYYSTEPDFTSGGTKMTLSGGTSTATFAPPQNMETIYYIRVRDNAGNWSEQKTVAARQDTLPPEYDVSIDPSDWSFDATFTINVTNVQDPGGSGIGEAFYSTVSGAESGISMMVVGDSASVTVAPDTNKQTTYYVRVRDNAGNLSEEKAVTAKRDTGLPTMTGLTISPTGWNTDGGSPTYTLTATGVEDFGGSGVKEVFYTTDANATSGTVMTLIGGTATATFVPPANAHTTYYVFVKDNAGNLSTPMSAEAKRDSTAPVIAGASIDPADWSNADSFTITATGVTDAGSSEIAEVFYSTTSGATSGTKMTLSGDTATATLTPPANAQTTYYIRAKDNAGNLSNELSVTAKRDTVAPVMNKATISPEVWSNGDSFLITAEGVLDTGGSEIAEVFYATDANAESGTAMTLTGDTATATLTPPENAATSYYVRIKDHAGNLSRAIEVTAFRDTLAPTISKLEIEPTGWSNGSGFTITASGIEDLGGSGIAQVFYSTTPDATTGTRIESYSPRTGTASVTVTPPADAQTTYYVRAIDKAGNLGPQLSVVAKRDTTAPTGSIKVGEHNIWSAFVNAITFGIYFNEQQPVVIDAADEGGSGLAGIQYYIASEALTRQQLLDVEETSWKDYAAFTLLPEDRYVVYAKLADNAGNVTYIGTDGMVFDTTAPVVGAEDTVDVTPPWAHIGAETVTVTASGVEDVMKTGLVSGETDVMSDIAYAYLMKTAGSTADVDIVGTFAKQEDGTFTCAMSPTEAEEIYYLRAVDNAGNWNDPSTSVKVTLRADLVAPVMENIRQEIVAGNVLVRVDATDVGSGMDKVYVAKTPDAESGVMLSKADENEYSGYLLEGGKLYLIAADKAGNRTVSELTELDDMDHIPPEITNVTANGDSTVSADITDTGSGVGMAYLSEDKDAETGMIMTRQNDTDTYVSPRVETGKTYYVIAYDKAGNRAVAEITIDAQPDKTRPVITGVQSPEDPAYGKVIVATANDPAGRQGEMVSGIDENRVYLLTSDDASATEGTPLTRQDDGTYVSPETRQAGTYYVFCYDKAGNRSKNAAVVVDAIVTGGGTPIRPSGAGGIDTYYQGGGSGAAMDSTKALVWMGGTLFRTMETGAYLAEDLVGQTQFHGRTSTNYSASLLLPEMETFAQTVSGTPGLRTIDLPDVDVKGQTAYPLHHGPSTTDTTDSELLNTAYFPQGNTSRAAGLKDTPTSGLTWWSRTGYKTTSRVWAVNQIGQVQSYTVTGNYGIRPEVYLDHTQAFFVPASAGGGAPESGETLVRSMGAFKSVSAGEARIQNAGTAVGNAQTYRVFTLDGTNAALPENRITASATSDGSLIIRYEGASHGADNYLSAMLVNKETHEKWTARLGNIPEANGEQAVSLPHVDGKGVVGDSNYLLYVWNENEAGRNACSPLQFEMSDLKLPDNPKIVKITQQPEDWTGASEEKTITAEATFAENCTQKKLEIAQNADGSGEKYTLTANADGTYSTTQVKTGGIWYVIATDGTNKLSAVQPFDVKIDTTPPTITSAGLGHGNTLYATAEDAQSGMGSMYWSQSADGTGLQEMTLSSGAYVSQELLGLGIYYVYAVDAVGNRSLPTAVEVSALYDTTPPDISNIVITQQEDGRFKVSFKVEDIAKAPEPASGVKPETVMWKSRKEGEYTAAQLDPEHADGSHYYFLTDDSIENTAHYIYAEDWAGNAAEKEAVNQTGVISVSIPVKMLFAALPDTYGGKFYAPEYTVTNNSETNKLNVSLVGFEADESSKGFELVAPGTKLAQNQMTLYLSGLGDTGGAFGGLSKTALLPGGFDMEKRLAIGNLAKAVPGADGADGKYTFAGDIPEYNLMQLQTLEALRAKFQMTLLFEKDYTG